MPRALRIVAAAVGGALLLLSQSLQPAAARCDPGRAPLAQDIYAGAQMGANPGVRFNTFEATIDNNDVPYIEGGDVTYSWMMMQNAAEPNQYLAVGLRYSAGQGKLSTTSVIIKYTEEDTGRLLVSTARALSTIGGSDSAPRIKMSMHPVDQPTQFSERIEVWVNGDKIHDTVWLHGAESFTLTRAYVHTRNRGSQIIGENTARHRVSSAIYRTQFGQANWFPSSAIDSGPYGSMVFGQGFVHTWDSNCQNPQ